MRLLAALMVALLVPTMAGCANPPGPLPTTVSEAAGFVPVHAVIRCYGPDEIEVVARNQAAWDQAWAECNGWAKTIEQDGKPPTAPPFVDFTRHMVVGFLWGTKPSSGYEVLISNVWAGGADGNVVDVVRLAPGPECATLALGMPAGQLVVVDRLNDPLGFVFRDALVRC